VRVILVARHMLTSAASPSTSPPDRLADPPADLAPSHGEAWIRPRPDSRPGVSFFELACLPAGSPCARCRYRGDRKSGIALNNPYCLKKGPDRVKTLRRVVFGSIPTGLANRIKGLTLSRKFRIEIGVSPGYRRKCGRPGLARQRRRSTPGRVDQVRARRREKSLTLAITRRRSR
jgi:hypothetical protein